MPTTEHITHPPKHRTDTTSSTDMPTRDEATEELLDKTDEFLDTIDEILDVEEVEHQLTLADLIRGGAKKTTQAYNVLENNCGTATCALGAAIREATDLGLL